VPRPRVPRSAPAADAEQSEVHLPTVPVDPLASLPPTEIITELAGREWIIPAYPAARWLRILWSQPFDPDAIFPGLVEDDDIDDILLNALLDGEIDHEDSFEVAMEILEAASGYSWWFTLRLVTLIGAGWARIGGMLLHAGVDMELVSLGAWCTAAMEMCVGNLPPKKAAEMLDQLLQKPPGIAGEVDPFDEVADSEAFMAAMNTTF
jgi:hypothetical protein